MCSYPHHTQGSCVCVFCTLLNVHNLNGPTARMPSARADMLGRFLGYGTPRDLYSDRNRTKTKFAAMEAVELDVKNFMVYLGDLKVAVCHTPLLLSMLKTSGKALKPPTYADVIGVYDPDQVLDDFITGKLSEIGHRLAVVIPNDDKAYGLAATSRWFQCKARGTMSVDVRADYAAESRIEESAVPCRDTPSLFARGSSVIFTRPTPGANTGHETPPRGGLPGAPLLAPLPPLVAADDVDRALRTSVMHYREYVYDVISPEMLVECWYLMHIRTREWRAANIAFYKLLVSTIPISVKPYLHAVQPGDGVSAFAEIRTHCLGAAGKRDTVLDKVTQVTHPPALTEYTNITCYLVPIQDSRLALMAVLAEGLTVKQFVDLLMVAETMAQVRADARYPGSLSDTLDGILNITFKQLVGKIQAWELKNPDRAPGVAAAVDSGQANAAESEQKGNNKQKKAWVHAKVTDKKTGVCYKWLNQGYCNNDRCRRRHHTLDEEEFCAVLRTMGQTPPPPRDADRGGRERKKDRPRRDDRRDDRRDRRPKRESRKPHARRANKEDEITSEEEYTRAKTSHGYRAEQDSDSDSSSSSDDEYSRKSRRSSGGSSRRSRRTRHGRMAPRDHHHGDGGECKTYVLTPGQIAICEIKPMAR